MARTLIFNFDGTANDPADAVQGTDRRGAIDDDNITNVLKFHFLAGGTLRRKPVAKNGQLCFYYSGVGTYGNVFQRIYNSGLAAECLDVRTILLKALADFADHYSPKDRILVTGFSRGAALARRFAALINDKVGKGDIIEAVFDTVASIGLPNMSTAERPRTEVVFENGHTLPANVRKALHMVSLDDKRKAFQPTLMNSEDRVQEVWFAGAHSDVGGGYYYDALSDVVFRFMINWVEELDWDISILSPARIDYPGLVDKDAGFSIQRDDLSIDPDYFGISHEQSRSALAEWATLTDRKLCTIKNDRVDPEGKPVVFHSVAQRIARERNYLPRSLQRVKHLVLYDNGNRKQYEGYFEHKENIFHYMKRLSAGDPVYQVPVFAHNKYNYTGVLMEQGGQYRIEVGKIGSKDQRWRDAGIECDANGWNRKSQKLGWKEIAIKGTEPFRRFQGADWFCLIGSIGDKDDGNFRIGKQTTVTAKSTGELCMYANDLNRFYGNNFGKLVVSVTRVA